MKRKSSVQMFKFSTQTLGTKVTTVIVYFPSFTLTPKVFSNFFCYFFINSLLFSRFDPSPMVVGPSQHSQNAKNSAASYMRFNLYSNLYSHSRSSRNARKKINPFIVVSFVLCFVHRRPGPFAFHRSRLISHSLEDFFWSDQEKN